jgi:hypothetical protein
MIVRLAVDAIVGRPAELQRHDAIVMTRAAPRSLREGLLARNYCHCGSLAALSPLIGYTRDDNGGRWVPVPSKTKGVFRILTGSFDNGLPSFLYTTSRLGEIKVPVREYTSHTFALLCLYWASYGSFSFPPRTSNNIGDAGLRTSLTIH